MIQNPKNPEKDETREREGEGGRGREREGEGGRGREREGEGGATGNKANNYHQNGYVGQGKDPDLRHPEPRQSTNREGRGGEGEGTKARTNTLTEWV